MKAKYIPNILSVIRLLLVPVFVLIYFLYDSQPAHHLAVFVFILAGVTDVIDGFLARHFNWITNVGKFLDPLADKLMQCTVLISMTISETVEMWFVAPYILKELLMLFGGLTIFRSSNRKVVVVSNLFGKLAAFVFYVAICLIMLLESYMTKTVINLICGVSLGVTVFALFAYTFQYVVAKPEEKNDNGTLNGESK